MLEGVVVNTMINMINGMWLQVAPQLGHLVVQGTPLKSVSLGDLAALPSLRSLSVCVSPNDPYSLTALTCLPHLTALQVSAQCDLGLPS